MAITKRFASEDYVKNEIKQLEEYVAGSGGTAFSSIEPMENDIPKMFFGGELQKNKKEVIVPFRYISKTKDISCWAKIKAQGNSSLNFPKKNQNIKLYKDAACTEKLTVNFKKLG